MFDDEFFNKLNNSVMQFLIQVENTDYNDFKSQGETCCADEPELISLFVIYDSSFKTALIFKNFQIKND